MCAICKFASERNRPTDLCRARTSAKRRASAQAGLTGVLATLAVVLLAGTTRPCAALPSDPEPADAGGGGRGLVLRQARSGNRRRLGHRPRTGPPASCGGQFRRGPATGTPMLSQRPGDMARSGAPAGVRVTGHACDVSDEAQVLRSATSYSSSTAPITSTWPSAMPALAGAAASSTTPARNGSAPSRLTCDGLAYLPACDPSYRRGSSNRACSGHGLRSLSPSRQTAV